MIKFGVDTPWDCFRHEVDVKLDIRYQLLTLSALDLDSVHHLQHALQPEKDNRSLLEGNQ